MGILFLIAILSKEIVQSLMFSTAVIIGIIPKKVSLKGFEWNDQQMPQKYTTGIKSYFCICMEADTFTNTDVT